MKFDCGERFMLRQRGELRAKRYNDWHKRFAWFPIKVGNHDCRWLEFVERKCPTCFYGDWFTGVITTTYGNDIEYRAINK